MHAALLSRKATIPLLLGSRLKICLREVIAFEQQRCASVLASAHAAKSDKFRLDLELKTLPYRPYASTPVWIWEAVVADAGLDAEVVRHTLRHTAATWLRIARVDVWAAADLLGMSVQTAVKIYGQWTLEGQDAAADALACRTG